MFTPQQIDQIAFSKAKFGGYNMQQVDEFLEPLTEDYVTLYKENALLKSKMRVLVGKLEEYRKNEASMKEAVANAQKTCDKMVAEAEAKCAKMLQGASDVAIANSQSSDAQIAAENARVEQARQTAAGKITELQEQLRSCIQALDRIKGMLLRKTLIRGRSATPEILLRTLYLILVRLSIFVVICLQFY